MAFPSGFPFSFPFTALPEPFRLDPLSFRDALDKFLHPGGALLLHLVSYMTVDIQSEGCRGMSEIALDCLDIITGPQGRHGIGMPQIMKAGVRSADRGHSLFEGPVDSWLRQMLPTRIGEN